MSLIAFVFCVRTETEVYRSKQENGVNNTPEYLICIFDDANAHVSRKAHY